MARNRQIVRQWRILIALRRRAYTLHMLAAKCGVTHRTIRRDLECLQEAGFPIYDVRGREMGDCVYWKFAGDSKVWPREEVAPVLDPDEVAVLKVS